MAHKKLQTTTTYRLLQVLVDLNLQLVRWGEVSVATFASEARVLTVVASGQIALTETSTGTDGGDWRTLLLWRVVEYNVLVRLEGEQTVTHGGKVVDQAHRLNAELALQARTVDLPAKLDVGKSAA